MRPAIRLLATTCVICVFAAGCGAEKKEPTMTPDEANRELTAVARAVMAVLAPGEAVDLNEDGPPSPCGGLGGNEYTKIKYGLIARSQAAPADATATFEEAASTLRKLGYEVRDSERMGDTTTLGFSSDAVKGEVLQHGDGPLSLGAETECLDNPDKGDPSPDVQPSS